MRLPLARWCRFSPVLPWRRLVGKVMLVSLVLPSLAAASPDSLEPIQLRKAWKSSSLEPIQLKRPEGVAAPSALPSGLPAWTPVAPEGVATEINSTPAAVEAAPTLAPVATAPEASQIVAEHTTPAAVESTPVPPTELTESAEAAPAPLPETKAEVPGFNQQIQSLADGRKRNPSKPVETVLPANLGRVTAPEKGTQADDTTVNRIIDIADQYADVPQLLLEVRGLAPMTSTDTDRQLAYQHAQLIVSGLVSAGIPYHRIAAFVTLLDAAPGSVDILRVR